MNNPARTTLPLFLLFLLSCAPLMPEPPMDEVPAGPLLDSQEQRLRSFATLAATARLHVERKGRKRSFESVAVLVRGQERLRIEAYGLLGESLAGLLWNGDALRLRPPGYPHYVPAPAAAMERLFGFALEPAELCAALAGTAWSFGARDSATARCGDTGLCALDLRRGSHRVRVWFDFNKEPWDGMPRSYDVYLDGTLLYRVRYDGAATSSGFLLPKTVVIESAHAAAALTVEYDDADVNAPLPEGAFTPDTGEGGGG